MAIVCPHCQQQLKLGSAKPGRYKPKCNKCGERFLLEVPDDPQAAPMVRGAPAAAASDGPKVAKSDSKTVADIEKRAASERTLAERFEATIAMSHAPSSELPDVGDSPTVPGKKIGTEATAVTVTPVATHLDVPERLGGYRLIRELGRGAMGAVYLANQLSLDRLVALKVIQEKFANSPTFLARFTREAYAAAQLVHHNVVQIYDLGSAGRTNFFSMEYVRGQTLAEIVCDQGPLEPKAAAGYILQAARGLAFAHNHGMVHRDVKPANLLLNEQGVVKVADLGLVKTPELESEEVDFGSLDDADASSLAAARSHVTTINAVVGTPAYMSPEQSKNASQVDHRADIYSLGCALYSLLTGHPPFEGKSALDVITKHRGEPVVRPETIVAAIQQPLSDIVLKMLAKSPEDRHATADEVVEDLEQFLGEGNAFSPTEEHVQTLESALSEFNSSPTSRVRAILWLAFVGGCAGLAAVSLLFSPLLAVGFTVLLMATIVSYFVSSGWRQQTHLFSATRQFIVQSRWSDRLTWLTAALLAAAIAYVAGALWICLSFAALGVLMGAAFHLVIDHRLDTERRGSLDRMEAMLKTLRLHGLDEQALRNFVAKFSGDTWEEFYEACFGFEAKLQAREYRVAEGLRPGKRFRVWREALINRFESRRRSQQTNRTQEHLARVEQEGLKAQGVSEEDARAQARRIEQTTAASRAQVMSHSETVADPAAVAAAKRARIKAMLAEARGGKEPPPPPLQSTVSVWLNTIAGSRFRFLAGSVLMIGFVLWIQQNKVLSGSEFGAAAATAIENREASALRNVQLDFSETKPLDMPIIGRYFDSLNAGLAGLLLLFTSLFRGWKISVFLLPAAVIALLGPALGVPGIDAIGGAYVSSGAIAIVLAVVGVLFAREVD
jgi:serine/threonine protein kinase